MSLDVISFRTSKNYKMVVDGIAEQLGTTRSEVMQMILDNFIKGLADKNTTEEELKDE